MLKIGWLMMQMSYKIQYAKTVFNKYKPCGEDPFNQRLKDILFKQFNRNTCFLQDDYTQSFKSILDRPIIQHSALLSTSNPSNMANSQSIKCELQPEYD